MGATKRPKLRVGETEKGVEYYYYRRPSHRPRKKQSADVDAPTNLIPHPKSETDTDPESDSSGRQR